MESQVSDEWYVYFDDFASLLDHPKSLVRNRVLHILAANARWDDKNRFDSVIFGFLKHITDEKPQYVPRILSCFREADLSRYKV